MFSSFHKHFHLHCILILVQQFCGVIAMACLNGANVTITPTASRVSANTNSNRRIIIKQKTQAVAKHALTSSFAFTKLPRNWRVSQTEGKKEGGLAVLVRAAAETGSMATEKSGIKIINNPPESKLAELGVRSWPKWGCPPSKFPWTYSSKETCFLLKGKVKVYPEGSNNAVEIGAGDLVEFPKGMNCTWDVSEAVDKHYNFE